MWLYLLPVTKPVINQRETHQKSGYMNLKCGRRRTCSGVGSMCFIVDRVQETSNQRASGFAAAASSNACFYQFMWSIKKWPQTRGGVFWFICLIAGRKMLNCYYNDLKTSEWAVHVLLTALIVSLSGLCGRNISNRTRRWCHNSGWSWGSWECWNQENGDAGHSKECDVIVQRRDNCQKRLRPRHRFNTG